MSREGVLRLATPHCPQEGLSSAPVRGAPPRTSLQTAHAEEPWGRRTARHGRERPGRGAALTVPIDVHGAGVALAVVVRVDLCRVVHVGTVVTTVPNLVLVIVELTGVEEELAVVLEGQGPRVRNGTGTSAGRSRASCHSRSATAAESEERAPARSSLLRVPPPGKKQTSHGRPVDHTPRGEDRRHGINATGTNEAGISRGIKESQVRGRR